MEIKYAVEKKTENLTIHLAKAQVGGKEEPKGWTASWKLPFPYVREVQKFSMENCNEAYLRIKNRSRARYIIAIT